MGKIRLSEQVNRGDERPARRRGVVAPRGLKVEPALSNVPIISSLVLADAS